MFVSEPSHDTAPDLRSRLLALRREQAAAVHGPLGRNRAYMADLASELASTEDAYVGVAVTEIATLRAQLGGPLKG